MMCFGSATVHKGLTVRTGSSEWRADQSGSLTSGHDGNTRLPSSSFNPTRTFKAPRFGVQILKRTWTFVGRVFGLGEDPTRWSFPIGTVQGVGMRMHWLVLLWAAVEIAASTVQGAVGVEHTFAGVVAFIAISMMRESARVIWARHRGIVAECSILWPLGGLNTITPRAAVRIAAHASSTFVKNGSGPSGDLRASGEPRGSTNQPTRLSRARNTQGGVLPELGGVFLGLLMVPIFALGALVFGVPASALYRFDPLNPVLTSFELATRWQMLAWWLYVANLTILVINLCIPATCFDAGRALSAALASRRRTRASAISFWIGLLAVGIIAIASLWFESSRIAIIALIGCLTTWMVFRSQTFLAEQAIARPAFTSSFRSINDSRGNKSGLNKSGSNKSGSSMTSGYFGGSTARRELGSMGSTSTSTNARGTSTTGSGSIDPAITGGTAQPAKASKNPIAPANPPGLSDTPVIEHPARPRTNGPAVSSGSEANRSNVTPNELDAVLIRISLYGMMSLTDQERSILARATRQLRGE